MTNSFGEYFKITTFGESHGKGIGVVIDGCPSGIEITENEIFQGLEKRRPGFSSFVSPRKEPDIPQILSGVYQGKTTGAPVCIWIQNQDARSKDYEKISHLVRPGHGTFSYLKKYGHFDPRGGRAHARETAARVAASALAQKICDRYGIQTCAYIKQMGSVVTPPLDMDMGLLIQKTDSSPIFCPDTPSEERMIYLLNELIETGDSTGAIVEAVATNVPPGLGDPMYMKIEAQLALAMLSIPATKGFEIGSGFSSVNLKGSEHNDEILSIDPFTTKKNLAGGVLGGITTGENIVMRIAFKPTSSIKQKQNTFDLEGKPATLEIKKDARHDPCVAIRGTQVVKSMFVLTLADRILAYEATKKEAFASV